MPSAWLVIWDTIILQLRAAVANEREMVHRKNYWLAKMTLYGSCIRHYWAQMIWWPNALQCLATILIMSTACGHFKSSCDHLTRGHLGACPGCLLRICSLAEAGFIAVFQLSDCSIKEHISCLLHRKPVKLQTPQLIHCQCFACANFLLFPLPLACIWSSCHVSATMHTPATEEVIILKLSYRYLVTL